MKLTFIGPPLSFSPSLYSSDNLPDPVNVAFLAKLASCSLVSPDGDTSLENQWIKSLLCLVQSGELPHEKGMINRQAMCKVLPLLESSGLKPGSGLHKWCGAIAVTALAPSPESVEKAPTQDPKPSVKMEEWRRSAFPLERLLGGIKALKKTNLSYADLYVSDDGTVPFSIPMMLEAVKAFDEKLAIPVKDNETHKKWIRALYPCFTFNETRVTNQDHVQDLLNVAYGEGKVLHNDEEIDLDAATHLHRVA